MSKIKGIIDNYRVFCEKNLWISRIAVIAIIIFISYIITYDMPDVLGIEPLFNGMYNLSIGYIVSLIFYVLQVYIPDTKEQIRCFEIIKPDIEKLYDEMGYILEILNSILKVNKDTLVNQGQTIFCKDKISNNGIEKTSPKEVDLKATFLGYEKNINNIIDKMVNKSIYQYNDLELLKLISKLQSSKLPHGLYELGLLYDIGKNENSAKLVFGEETISYINEFRNIYDEFDKYNFNKVKHTMSKMTEEEEKEYLDKKLRGLILGAVLKHKGVLD